MFPDPAWIDAITKLGLTGGLVIAVAAYATGRTRVGSLVDQARAEEAERRDKVEARLIAERDAAIALAQSYADQFERALDVIDAKTPK